MFRCPIAETKPSLGAHGAGGSGVQLASCSLLCARFQALAGLGGPGFELDVAAPADPERRVHIEAQPAVGIQVAQPCETQLLSGSSDASPVEVGVQRSRAQRSHSAAQSVNSTKVSTISNRERQSIPIVSAPTGYGSPQTAIPVSSNPEPHRWPGVCTFRMRLCD